MDTIPLSEYRCRCGRLLFKGVMVISRVDIKCKRCGNIMPFSYDSENDGALHYGMLIDNTLTIREVSKSAVSILGFTREELIGKSVQMLSPQKEGTQGSVFPINARVRYSIIDLEHRTKEGSILSVRVQARHLPARSEPLLLCLYEVLSVVEKATLPEDASQEFCTYPLSAQVDRQGQFIYVSKNLAETLHREPGSLIGSSCFELLAPVQQSEYEKHFQGMCKQRMFYAFQHALLKDVDTEAFRIYHSPSYRDDGYFSGYINDV
jgi:PAS domain S-box-containing protein